MYTSNFNNNIKELNDILEVSERSDLSEILSQRGSNFQFKIIDLDKDYFYFEEIKLKYNNNQWNHPIIINDEELGFCIFGFHLF